MKKLQLPELSHLQSLFSYEEQTGELKWIIKRPGSIAGSLNNCGHLQVIIDGRAYMVHRVIWKMLHGKDPDGVVDHINGIRSDNRAINLRDVSISQNSLNQLYAKENNRSGALGVYWDGCRRKWRASICVSGKRLHIGYFDDVSAASRAYQAKKEQIAKVS